MNEHLQELKIGGRPMTKLELANKEIERLNNIIKLKTDFIAELLKIILVARDYELHEKCEVRAKLYEEKLQELKGSDKE